MSSASWNANVLSDDEKRLLISVRDLSMTISQIAQLRKTSEQAVQTKLCRVAASLVSNDVFTAQQASDYLKGLVTVQEIAPFIRKRTLPETFGSFGLHAYAKWTQQEDTQLYREIIELHLRIDEVAKIHQRSAASIRTRLYMKAAELMMDSEGRLTAQNASEYFRGVISPVDIQKYVDRKLQERAKKKKRLDFVAVGASSEAAASSSASQVASSSTRHGVAAASTAAAVSTPTLTMRRHEPSSASTTVTSPPSPVDLTESGTLPGGQASGSNELLTEIRDTLVEVKDVLVEMKEILKAFPRPKDNNDLYLVR